MVGTKHTRLVSNHHIKDAVFPRNFGPTYTTQRVERRSLVSEVGSAMDTLDLAEPADPQPLLKRLAQVGGLLAAIAVAARFCRLPLPHIASWGGLIGSSAFRVLATFLASAATMWGIRLIRPDTVSASASASHPILRISLGALWLAPLTLLLCEKSWWAMPLAAVFLARVTKSFWALEARPNMAESGDWLVLSLTSSSVGVPDPSLPFRRLCFAFAAALCAEAGILAGFTGYLLVGATMVGTSSAVLTWFALEAHTHSQQSRVSEESPSRVLLTVALAIVLTAAGLMRYTAHARHWGGFGLPSAANLTHGRSPFERRAGGQIAKRHPVHRHLTMLRPIPASCCGLRNKPTRLSLRPRPY